MEIEDIIKKAKQGDTEAVNLVIEKYKPFILKEAGKYRIPGYAYEDIVQHGYLSVIKALKLYKIENSSYNGYFLRTIKNNIMDLARGKIKHYREIPDNDFLDAASVNISFTIEDEVIAYEQIKKLYSVLDSLTSEEKDIITRFYINNEKLAHIAEDYSLSYKQAFRWKKNILEKIKNHM